MKTVSIREAKNRFTELAREVEAGERILVTRNGKPLLELVQPQTPTRGLDMAALRAFYADNDIESPIGFVAGDFDDPLPEDFLIMPLPEIR